MNYFEQIDFDQTVYTVGEDTKISSHTLRDLCEEKAETTTTPEGVGPKMHIRNDTELWTWGTGGNDRHLLYRFQTAKEAEHALLLAHRWDLLNGQDMPTVFFSEAEAEAHAHCIRLDLAEDLIYEAEEKGCASVAPGVWLVTAERMQEEQAGWEESDASKNLDFNTSKLWLSASDGAVEPVSTPEEVAEHMA